MALTKAHVTDNIQNQLGFSKKRSMDVIESLLEVMKKGMENGGDVLVSGFGKFCVKEKKSRRGRNPSTGKDLMLNPRRVVTFKCSGKLREKINGKAKAKRAL